MKKEEGGEEIGALIDKVSFEGGGEEIGALIDKVSFEKKERAAGSLFYFCFLFFACSLPLPCRKLHIFLNWKRQP